MKRRGYRHRLRSIINTLAAVSLFCVMAVSLGCSSTTTRGADACLLSISLPGDRFETIWDVRPQLSMPGDKPFFVFEHGFQVKAVEGKLTGGSFAVVVSKGAHAMKWWPARGFPSTAFAHAGRVGDGSTVIFPPGNYQLSVTYAMHRSRGGRACEAISRSFEVTRESHLARLD